MGEVISGFLKKEVLKWRIKIQEQCRNLHKETQLVSPYLTGPVWDPSWTSSGNTFY
jgi:hypothetical protein